MKKERTSGTGKGLIAPGGDKNKYLGHFRNADVMKRGHNIGEPGGSALGETPKPSTPMPPAGGVTDPGGAAVNLGHPSLNPLSNPKGFAASTRVKPTYDAALNPVRAQRQANRAAGIRGTAEGRAQMQAARQAAKGIPQAQRRATAAAARQGARAETQTARGTARAERQDAVGTARGALKGAVGNVRAARQGLRSAIRGGDVAGAAKAFGGLQTAKGARKEAKMGVRRAKRGM